MDPEDMLALQRRSDLVTYLTCWARDSVHPDILDAILDELPERDYVGWIVVWMPFNEGDYEARWTTSRFSMWWAMWQAKRARSPLCFVLDVRLAWLESGVNPCVDDGDEDDSPYDYEDEEDDAWPPPS